MFKKFIILLVVYSAFFPMLGCSFAEVNDSNSDCNSIIAKFYSDANNFRGNVRIFIKKQDYAKIGRVSLYIDGEKYRDFFLYGEDPCGPSLEIITQLFKNGIHILKIESMTPFRKPELVCSYEFKAFFNNDLSEIKRDKSYKLGEDFHFYAHSSSPLANYNVEVIDYNGVKYSESFSGDIQAVIPPETFNDHDRTGLYEIRMKDSNGNIIFSDIFGEHFDANDFKENSSASSAEDCNSITPIFEKDKNNLIGDVKIHIGEQDWQRISEVVLFIDEKPSDKKIFLYGKDPCGPSTEIRTQFFRNGLHAIKIISLSIEDNPRVICSSGVDVVFNNDISEVRMDEGYKLGEDFHFSANSSSPSIKYIVEVVDKPNDKTVYTGSFTGNIQAVIPGKTFKDDSQFYKLTVKDLSSNVKFEEFFGRDYEAEDNLKENSSAPSAK